MKSQRRKIILLPIFILMASVCTVTISSMRTKAYGDEVSMGWKSQELEAFTELASEENLAPEEKKFAIENATEGEHTVQDTEEVDISSLTEEENSAITDSETLEVPEAEMDTTQTDTTFESYQETEVEPYTLYVQTSLNVRESPDKDAEKLFTMPVNAEPEITAQCDNGWVAVTYNGMEGYCNSAYLGEDPAVVQEPVEANNSVEEPGENEAAGENPAQESAEEPASESTGGYTCLVRGNCSDGEWNQFVSAWNVIPDKWKERINDSGWQIICTNDDFWTSYGYSQLDGLTVYAPKCTYIRAGGTRVSIVVPHEIGHIVDCYYGFPSISSEFIDLFNAESAGFEEYDSATNQSKDNSTEYFAIIWLQILLAPSTESSAPNSFAFVRNYY
jgi:hypothetical protein